MKLQISPYNTRQEEYREDPWKMLMICFMLNQTSHKQVDQVRHEFFNRYPNAEALLKAEDKEISELIKPLGFYNKRVKAWKEFCQQWIFQSRIYGGSHVPLSVLSEMKGVGKYALDSWKVFQLYEYDTDVEDHVLNWYVDWARKEVKKIEQEGKPTLVYYVHMKDERGFVNNWNVCRDYACCVIAKNIEEAIEKTERIALNQKGSAYLKILGVVPGKHEWVDETSPIKTNNELYRKQTELLFEKIKANPVENHGKNLKYKF